MRKIKKTLMVILFFCILPMIIYTKIEATTNVEIKVGTKFEQKVDKNSNCQFKVIKQAKKNKAGKVSLIKYVGNEKTLNIKDAITYKKNKYNIVEIEKDAFKNNEKIESLILNEKIEKIGKGAFNNCKKLKDITILKNVKKIESEVFKKCELSKLVIYCEDKSTAFKYAKKNKIKIKIINETKEEAAYVYNTDTCGLSIRKTASKTGVRVGVFRDGAKITVLKESGKEWYLVKGIDRDGNFVKGYSSREYIKLENEKKDITSNKDTDNSNETNNGNGIDSNQSDVNSNINNNTNNDTTNNNDNEDSANIGNNISESEIFIKQEERGLCTLASVSMMLRSKNKSLLEEWSYITDDVVKPFAWIEGVGIRSSFTFEDKVVDCRPFKVGTEVDIKKDELINMLKSNKEGIVIYTYSVPHAVLLTKYDSNMDTFYVLDPGKSEALMIPLSESIMNGKTQTDKLSNINKYWYIK